MYPERATLWFLIEIADIFGSFTPENVAEPYSV